MYSAPAHILPIFPVQWGFSISLSLVTDSEFSPFLYSRYVAKGITKNKNKNFKKFVVSKYMFSEIPSILLEKRNAWVSSTKMGLFLI